MVETHPEERLIGYARVPALRGESVVPLCAAWKRSYLASLGVQRRLRLLAPEMAEPEVHRGYHDPWAWYLLFLSGFEQLSAQ